MSLPAGEWELFYWPGLPGRGEYIRLLFEEAGVPFIDQAIVNPKSVPTWLYGNGPQPTFAPPVLKKGDLVLFQTANICMFLGQHLALCPPQLTYDANAVAMFIMDIVSEVHDTHHPIATSLYYHEQKPEAKRKSEIFLKARLQQYLGFLDKLLRNSTYLVKDTFTYVDLMAMQTLFGLEHAFPRAYARLIQAYPKLSSHRDAIANRSNIKAYLESSRRVPWSPDGIFRQLPELDE